MMEKSDNKFKKFVDDPDLETSSDGAVVDLKNIGRFKVFSHNPKQYINVYDINNASNMRSLSTNDDRKGLFEFLRGIFKSQTKIKNRDHRDRVLDLLNNSRESKQGALRFAQWMAKIAGE